MGKNNKGEFFGDLSYKKLVIPVLDTGIYWQIVGSSPTMTRRHAELVSASFVVYNFTSGGVK